MLLYNESGSVSEVVAKEVYRVLARANGVMFIIPEAFKNA
jgi:hypothetical protein